VTKQVVDGMVERGFGRIINISSVNGQKGQFGQTNYSTAKAGIHGFTMSLAQEVATKGVTVNTVSPGYIGTDMVKAIRPEVLEKIVATIPVRRLGRPDEIGSIVSWLASEESGFDQSGLLAERRSAYGLTIATSLRVSVEPATRRRPARRFVDRKKDDGLPTFLPQASSLHYSRVAVGSVERQHRGLDQADRLHRQV
jgi:hypothetical protein